MAVRTQARRTESDQHWESLQTSSRLTQTFNRMYRPMAAVVPAERGIELLNQAEISFVVMGMHGAGSWRSEPRATQDVDALVIKGDFYNIAAHIMKSLDLDKLGRLADKVYPDGSREIAKLIQNIKNGKPIRF